MIFYELPHRLLKSLEQFMGYFDTTQASVSRELTKMFKKKSGERYKKSLLILPKKASGAKS